MSPSTTLKTAISSTDRTRSGKLDRADSANYDVGAILLKAAWLAILLGLLMQVLSLGAALLAGGKGQSVGEFLRDVTQKVSWSTFVCVGLAIGSGAAKMKPA